MIIKESAFGDSVKIRGQEQCEIQKDEQTKEYLLQHCTSLPPAQLVYL